MTLRLYMDEHVPRAITNGLRDRGIDVLTVQQDVCTGHSDSELLHRAMELGRVVFTRDTNFLAHANRFQQDGIEFSGVVYAQQLRVRVGQCVQELELLATLCDPKEMMNRVEHLPL